MIWCDHYFLNLEISGHCCVMHVFIMTNSLVSVMIIIFTLIVMLKNFIFTALNEPSDM